MENLPLFMSSWEFAIGPDARRACSMLFSILKAYALKVASGF